ncbi:Stp1/IreP family PP2C-type Ser/Thr phosphatase [Aerococcus sanguinicola]|uniref:Protein phosphatase n=1 Tax=Aerococcus sanguinicola TaxID=119206 RepID=A0A0X8FBP8_9LACT|nr:Stp1/IreP family PP2C-type Ser/Thr phosphatase [Aerococcus sanguinicola]AMB93577.1 protein phosphatase [Aerococcus sanguinicola]MDK7050797.1 Stp1/IreP family PP2C-type Ser/Thr phosphatase [Aerococcus sanguinicola]PKZ21695.1 serine/threonine-protein phosphatase [Aerococcus sanguinicola]
MEVAKLTDIGIQRKENQDQLGDFYNQSDQALLILCDGMGGQNAGDVASEMALFQVGKAWEETVDMTHQRAKDWFQLILQDANDRLIEKSQQYQDLEGMGTTVVAIAVMDREATIAHIGDSRAYQIRDGAIKQITKDHSYVQELLDLNMISEEEAKAHPQKNIITQSLGVKPDFYVDIDRLHLYPDDVFVLCSDGLSDMLADEDILAIIDHYPHLDESIQRLVEAANQAGGKDNISVILARIEGSDEYANRAAH